MCGRTSRELVYGRQRSAAQHGLLWQPTDLPTHRPLVRRARLGIHTLLQHAMQANKPTPPCAAGSAEGGYAGTEPQCSAQRSAERSGSDIRPPSLISASPLGVRRGTQAGS